MNTRKTQYFSLTAATVLMIFIGGCKMCTESVDDVTIKENTIDYSSTNNALKETAESKESLTHKLKISGLYIDPITNLMWQSPPTDDSMTWNDALNYCENLDLGGYGDWRLPTISELRSLIRGCTKTQTGGACKVVDNCLEGSCWDYETCMGCEEKKGPAKGCYWPSEVKGSCNSHYWSSSTNYDSNVLAWHINFYDAFLSYYNQTDLEKVRCVRGALLRKETKPSIFMRITALKCISSPTSKGGDMCLVPSGKFWMGCNEAVHPECPDNEKPYHEVYLDAFYVDKYEVTASEYKICVTAGGCTKAETGPGFNYDVSGKENHPINGVYWFQANGYCEWVGKRLLREAEWEKAARGTDGRYFPWGDQVLDCNKAVHSLSPCSSSGTDAVGSKPTGASPYGVMDMVGNVWEWVNDKYEEDYYFFSPDSNPPGPASGDYRVLRGGSWSDNSANSLRTSFRTKNNPGHSYNHYGFRCAVSAL